MTGIREWLEGLGLGEFGPAFERERIEPEDLPALTERDLKELGVPMGPRKRILGAAAKLVRDVGTAAEPAAAETRDDAAPAPVREAERRQITVLFCDLVGSTALSEQLDPEDLRSLMQAYQQACGAVIERYEGHVAQYLGDGLMTYFGWPRAHEDDAERAVRAGLEVVEAVKAVEAPEPLRVRVGIATGPVVVGETGAGDASVPKLAVGETPNLAARVQGLAGPDEIVVAPSTHRLVGGAFDYDDLGKHVLKGIVEPVQAWRVTGLGRAEGRFEAAHAGGLTPLVGRETEIAMLAERWSQAKEGEGQVVLLCGEPGIGKSRITQVLRERTADEPHTRLRYQCSPYHTNSAFYPLIQHLERAAGFTHEDPASVKLDKLETLLAQGTEVVAEVAPLFAAVLSIAIESRYAPVNLSPQRQKEKIIEAMANQVVGLSRKQPVLVILEDAHWIDPTTLEWLGETIARIGNARALVVITYRPEFDPPWLGQAHVTVHTLNRLSRRHGAAMVDKVTGGKALPAEVLDEIVAKTDGVPLFVEELTKTVLEAGFLKDAGDRYRLDGPLPPLAIPSTLQDSLMARLDRLAPVKEVAQIGAVIGRAFAHELLAAVSPLADHELRDALRQLTNSELVFRRGTPPDATYTFKHALVQDAAYGSLLRSRRQQLHTRIAEALEKRFPDTTDSEPELLAHHYTEAGLPEQAINYWLKAGERASLRSANIEAISHLKRGLELVLSQEEGRERDRRELEIQVALGPPITAIKGYAADETGQVYARALDLCRKFERPPQIFQVLYGLTARLMFHGNLLEARDLGEEFARQADTHGDLAARVVAHRTYGTCLLYLGNLAGARDQLEQALALYDAELHGSISEKYGHDPKVFGSVLLSLTLAVLGYPDRGLTHAREAVAYAEELKHPYNIGIANFLASYLHFIRREPGASLAYAEANLKIAVEQRFPFLESVARVVVGWARAEECPEKGVLQLTEGLKHYRTLQMRLYLPFFLGIHAETCMKAGRTAEALAGVAEALSIAETDGERWYDAELRRLNAELLLAGSDREPAKAESSLMQALEVARSQEARLWELRAATSLARLWQRQGKTEEANDLLGPVYGWFSEGFDTADLKEAKALLDELAA